MAINENNNPKAQVTKVADEIKTSPDGTTYRQETFESRESTGDDFTNIFSSPSSNNQQSPKDQKFDWINLDAVNYYQVNTTIASKDLTQLHKEMEKYLADYISPDLEVTVLPLDRNATARLAVSVIVVAVRSKKTGNEQEDLKRPVAFHIFLIEGSIEAIPSRIENLNGRQIEVLNLTSDTFDTVMVDTVSKALRSIFPQAKEIVSSHGEVIPRNFNLSEEENIHRVLVNAIASCQVRLTQRVNNFRDLNLANARQNTSFLTQSIQFTRGIEEDAYGNPVRSDITMNMIAQANVDRNSPWINEQRIITHATGFIELNYYDIHNIFGMQGYNTQLPVQQVQLPDGTVVNQVVNNIPQPVYQPQFVITQLFNAKIQTLPGILLALINASAIRENEAFLRALMPMPNHDGVDLSDIGNIGYDISLDNDGTFDGLKTTPDKFSFQDLYQLYMRYFHKGLLISQDIPDCSSISWQYRTIMGAANKVRGATNDLRKAFNVLTNGLFDKHYTALGGTGELVKSTNNRIMLGYYIDYQGKKRDIRDFDYLAACGLAGKKGREEVMAYTDTYNAYQQMSAPERLDLRRKLISTYFPNVTYTGYANRVNWEAAAIEAACLAAKECGYTVSSQIPHQENLGYRANAGYVAGCILNSQASGIFNTNFVNMNSQYNRGYQIPNPAYGGGYPQYPNPNMGYPQQPFPQHQPYTGY